MIDFKPVLFVLKVGIGWIVEKIIFGKTFPVLSAEYYHQISKRTWSLWYSIKFLHQHRSCGSSVGKASWVKVPQKGATEPRHRRSSLLRKKFGNYKNIRFVILVCLLSESNWLSLWNFCDKNCTIVTLTLLCSVLFCSIDTFSRIPTKSTDQQQMSEQVMFITSKVKINQSNTVHLKFKVIYRCKAKPVFSFSRICLSYLRHGIRVRYVRVKIEGLIIQVTCKGCGGGGPSGPATAFSLRGPGTNQRGT